MNIGNPAYKKVVFVDGDKELVDSYYSILDRKNLAGYFIHFENPQKCIEYLKNIKVRDEIPKYILLDLYMPIMDGFQFLKKFDRMSDLKNAMEIYVCTSSRKREDREKAMSYPFVSAYHEKPLPSDFIELLITDRL